MKTITRTQAEKAIKEWRVEVVWERTFTGGTEFRNCKTDTRFEVKVVEN